MEVFLNHRFGLIYSILNKNLIHFPPFFKEKRHFDQTVLIKYLEDFSLHSTPRVKIVNGNGEKAVETLKTT